MKKKIIFFLVLTIAMMLLASCKDPTGGSTGGGGTGTKPTFDSDVIWAPGADVNIVLEDGLDYPVKTLADSIKNKTGVALKYGYFSDLTNEKCDREIVIGNTRKAISQRALQELEKFNTGDEYYGYIIYAYNGSLAVVWSHDYAFEDAMEYFTTELLKIETLKLANGVVKEEAFFLKDKIADKREENRSEGFDKLVSTLGEEAVKELKNLYGLYTEDLYIWMANLYDPAIGGFYFSNSGRNTEGFLPDLESTVQVLRALEEGGMFENYGHDYGKAISVEMKAKIVEFIKSLQSPVDGAFYHPQWGTTIIDARRSRDMEWATSMLKVFGEKPYWNIPNGTLGEYGVPGTPIPTASVTMPLIKNTANAVSKVVLTADAEVVLPTYLQSLDAWAKYIDGLKVTADPYTAGNTLASQHGMITVAGKEYEDYLIDYLNKTQNAELGIWADDGVLDFETANGLMKIGMIYVYFGRTIPNAENAIKSSLDIIMMPDDYHICCVYNPWTVIDFLLDSIKNAEGEDRAEQIRATVRARAAELIKETRNKIAKYAVGDGGFHYHIDGPTHYSQKAYVACSPVPESDVNASTIMSTNVTYCIAAALGVPYVQLWYNEDCEYFLDVVNNLQPVIKDEMKDPEPVTFDGFTSADGEQKFGIEYLPSSNATVVVPEIPAGILGDDGNSKYYGSAVVQNPDPDAKPGDLVYKVNQNTYDDGQDYATNPLTTIFTMTNAASIGNCYILDTDMMITKGQNVVMQLFYYNDAVNRGASFSLNIRGYTQGGQSYIKFDDNFAGPDGEKNSNITDGIPFNKWFNLRIEMYKIYSTGEGAGETELTIKAKMYINDVYVGESEASDVNAITGKINERGVSAVGFMTYRYTDAEFYLDNILVRKSAKEYTKETIPLDPDVIIPETTGERGTGVYYNDETMTSGKRYNFTLTRGESEFFSVKEDADGNKTWGTTTAGKISLTQQEDQSVYFFRVNDSDKEFYACYAGNNITGDKKNNQAFIFEQDIVFTGLEKKAQKDVYKFEVNAGPAFGYGFTLNFSTDENGNIIFDTEVLHTAKNFAGIKQDEWTNLRFEVYGETADDMKIKVYVNNEYAATIKANTFYKTDYSTKIRYWICNPITDRHGIMLDNLFISRVVKAYVEESTEDIPDVPGTPSTDGTLGNGSDTDGGGWL